MSAKDRTTALEEFYDLVARMREAQKGYFKQRTQFWLDKSKQLERAVDNSIQQLAGNGRRTLF